eukprot:CAMPEP_0180430318 /NCGR_PEP_ID=MMETSP1036_2-20121128/7823_1 /TAXON_ID=632150 /ORGANISM="Azadinium spinosum, Strain 3D9" /LENGTH=517 /DNA_ID=CAMNT_0022436047 /DNA_START=23 /DNA_END=1572 /DNA_ORIENTATION=-
MLPLAIAAIVVAVATTASGRAEHLVGFEAAGTFRHVAGSSCCHPSANPWPVQSAAACERRCAAYEPCDAFIFSPSEELCFLVRYLKRAVDGQPADAATRPAEDRIFGLVSREGGGAGSAGGTAGTGRTDRGKARGQRKAKPNWGPEPEIEDHCNADSGVEFIFIDDSEDCDCEDVREREWEFRKRLWPSREACLSECTTECLVDLKETRKKAMALAKELMQRLFGSEGAESAYFFEVELGEEEEEEVCGHSCSSLCDDLAGPTGDAGPPPSGVGPGPRAARRNPHTGGGGQCSVGTGHAAVASAANATTAAERIAEALRLVFDRAGLRMGKEAAPLLLLGDASSSNLDDTSWLLGDEGATVESILGFDGLDLGGLEGLFTSEESAPQLLDMGGGDMQFLDLDLAEAGAESDMRFEGIEKLLAGPIAAGPVAAHVASAVVGDQPRSRPPMTQPLLPGPFSGGAGGSVEDLPLQPLRQGLLKGLPEAARWAQGSPPFLERLRDRALLRLRALLGGGRST